MVSPFGVRCCVPACGTLTCETVESQDACANLGHELSTSCRFLADVDADPASAPSWESVVHPFLYVPCISQLSLLVLWTIFGRLYPSLMRTTAFRRIIQNHIGCFDNPIPRLPCFMQFTCIGQMMASLCAVGIFVFNCYMVVTLPQVTVIDGVLGSIHAFHNFIFALHHEFRLRYLFTSQQLVDVLTVPNMILVSLQADPGEHTWLTLNFLRSVQALNAYEVLDKLGAMRHGMGEVAHEVVLMVLRLATIVICFASSVFLLEVLGELPFGKETLLPTAMGDISFFTMLYWVIETISTVGYGDFAPKTFLSRLTTMTFMIAGVAFFTTEANRIVSVAASQKKGTGEYIKTGTRDHLVLFGGGVRNVDTTLIFAFLDELYHPSYRNSWPDLVVMSIPSSIEKLREAVELHLDRSAQSNITYLVGTPLRLPDLRRCRCDCAQLVLIIADTTGHLDPIQEDKMNILRTLSLKTGFPRTPLRLMLLMAESKEKALSVGIRDQRCFSVNEVRSGLLWTSCRCTGWNTMFSNIIVTTDAPDISETDRQAAPWLENYLAGMDYEMYGFLAAQEFHEQPYEAFISEAYRRNGVCVFAAQINGRIELAPITHVALVDANVVFFALAVTEESLNGLVLEATKLQWKDVFARNRWGMYAREDTKRSAHRFSAHRSLLGRAVTNSVRSTEDFPRREPSSETSNSPRVDDLATEGTSAALPETRPLLNSSRGGASFDSRRNTNTVAFHASCDDQDTPQEVEEENELAYLLGGEDILSPEDIMVLDRRVLRIRNNANAAPFILLLDLSGSWVQVIPFILRNRTKLTPFRMPIVVLSLAPPPRSYADQWKVMDDPNVGVTIGNPVWAQDLLRSGVTECCVIVCLGLTIDHSMDEGSGTDGTEMLDADVVLLQRMLQLLDQDTKHVILEFKRAQNMRLLPTFGSENEHQSYQLQKTTEQNNDTEGPRWSLSHCFCCSSVAEEWDHQYCLDPRFASGQIFTPHVLGAMVACEYRMPGIIELTHVLMAPHPEHDGSTGEQAKESTRENMLWQIHVKKKHASATYGQVFSDLLHDSDNPALALGIMRRFDDDSTSFGYVWTNPAADTQMVKTDLIFVLANSGFGKAAYDEGLLPFSGRT